MDFGNADEVLITLSFNTLSYLTSAVIIYPTNDSHEASFVVSPVNEFGVQCTDTFDAGGAGIEFMSWDSCAPNLQSKVNI